jgi:CHAD domain-containing protein
MRTERDSKDEYRDLLPHLHRREAVGAGLNQVVCACCALAVELKTHEPDEAAVHRARQALKRARAVLRIGETMGIAGAKAARRRLAGHARELSPMRDATMATKVAQRLARRLDGALQAGAMEIIAKEPAPRDATWWRSWKRKLAAEARRIGNFEWTECTPQDLSRALRKSVKRVRRHARKALASNEIEIAHDWRKAVIILREQVMVLRPLLGSEASDLREQLRELARRLGKATDFNLFAEAVREQNLAGELAKTRSRLAAATRSKRERAIKNARKRWPKVRRALRKTFA